MKTFISIMVGVVALIGFLMWWCYVPCLRYETQLVHHPAWTSFMYIGKIMYPQYYPAYDSWDEVCVEYQVED